MYPAKEGPKHSLPFIQVSRLSRFCVASGVSPSPTRGEDGSRQHAPAHRLLPPPVPAAGSRRLAYRPPNHTPPRLHHPSTNLCDDARRRDLAARPVNRHCANSFNRLVLALALPTTDDHHRGRRRPHCLAAPPTHRLPPPGWPSSRFHVWREEDEV